MPRGKNQARVAYPCRVCMFECTMEQESIQCDGCECWFHQDCIKMYMAQYLWLIFSVPNLQFFCCQCCVATDGYYFAADLSRIGATSPDVAVMRGKAESELNLLLNYLNRPMLRPLLWPRLLNSPCFIMMLVNTVVSSAVPSSCLVFCCSVGFLALCIC